MTRVSSGVRCAAAVVLLVVAWIDGAGLDFHARAMACCTHRHDCGGNLRAPDTCCESMGHTAPAKAGTIDQSPSVDALTPVAVVEPPPIDEPSVIAGDRALVRAHDPPHLHTFALLI